VNPQKLLRRDEEICITTELSIGHPKSNPIYHIYLFKSRSPPFAWETGDSESAKFSTFLESCENSSTQNLKLFWATQNGAGPHHPPPLQVPPTLIGIGCLWAILEEAHIIMLAIHPSFQGQGLGQALLWALLKSACDRQLERSIVLSFEQPTLGIPVMLRIEFTDTEIKHLPARPYLPLCFALL